MALLDSIFDKNPNPYQYDTKKYDKSFFESCNFWEVPGADSRVEAPSNQSGVDNSNSYMTNKRPIEPNFE